MAMFFDSCGLLILVWVSPFQPFVFPNRGIVYCAILTKKQSGDQRRNRHTNGGRARRALRAQGSRRKIAVTVVVHPQRLNDSP
jgi:hypothetical protein